MNNRSFEVFRERGDNKKFTAKYAHCFFLHHDLQFTARESVRIFSQQAQTSPSAGRDTKTH